MGKDQPVAGTECNGTVLALNAAVSAFSGKNTDREGRGSRDGVRLD